MRDGRYSRPKNSAAGACRLRLPTHRGVHHRAFRRTGAAPDGHNLTASITVEAAGGRVSDPAQERRRPPADQPRCGL